MHYFTVNISGLNGDSMADGVLGCTTCSEKTSIVAVSANGVDGNVEGEKRWTPTGCTSDYNCLGPKKCNLEATPRCSGSAIVLQLSNISIVCIHINKIELLVPNNKIHKHKNKQFENYTIFNSTHDTCDAGDLSILDGNSPTLLSPKSYRNTRTLKI